MRLISSLRGAAIGTAVIAGTLVTALASSAGVAAADAVQASAPAANARIARTHVVVVRPVRKDGRPAPGFRVEQESAPGFSCYGEGASPVALDPDIRFCGPSATDTVACWKGVHHAALCLRNPESRTLARIKYTGPFNPVSAPKAAVPERLVLDNTSRCNVRDGGAWSMVKMHPRWVGFYSCEGGLLYGPARGDGINSSRTPWTAHSFGGRLAGPGRVRTIATAYFVGTAH